VVKFNQAGEVLWAKTFDYGGKSNNANGIAVDSANNIVIAGYFNDSGASYDDDYYLTKMNPTGEIVWQRTHVTSGHDMSFAVAVDSADNIVQVGQSPYYGLHAIKYNPEGELLWSQAYYTGHYGRAEAVVIGPDDTIYMTGYYHNDTLDDCGTATHDIRTIKLSSSGTILWIKDYDGGCNDSGHAISTDKYGNVFVLGRVNLLSAVVGYNPSGDLIHEMVDIDSGQYARYGLAFNNKGSFYAVGHTNSDPKDILLVKYGFGHADSDGDNLPDLLEDSICTESYDADTDDDGISDGVEDANRNGLVDTGETDPCLTDTDGDGIQDGTEIGLTQDDIGPDTDTGVFIPDADPSTTTDPLNVDSDGDGFLDGEEDLNHNGVVDGNETDPNTADQRKAMPWIPLLLLNESDSCSNAAWVNKGTEVKALNVGSCGGQFKFVTLTCTPETVGTQVFIADQAIYPRDDPEHQGVSATISENELTYTYQNGCINEHFEYVTAVVYECQCQ